MVGESFNIRSFAEPPEKARRMFQAVIELIQDNADLSTIKVSDITTRAGIGKGTAYEYFSSKEEILTLALLYEYKTRLSDLEEELQKQDGFRKKIFCLLDWLDENSGYNFSFRHMLQISSGNADFCETVQQSIPEEIMKKMEEYLFENGNTLMELGYKEGLYTECDPVKRRLAMAGLIAQFLFTVSPEAGRFQMKMDQKAAKEFVYDGMLKVLNKA